MNTTKKMSFIRWMLTVNLASIVFVGFYLATNTGVFLSIRTNADYREIATATSVNVAHTLESLSDEDFQYYEESGILKKGDIVITDKAFKKSLEFNGNIHHTIFWGNKRVLTDVTDNNGRTVTGTTLDDQDIISAINRDGIFTDNNVEIYGSKYSVCYYPIRNGNTIVGYVFTGVKQDEAIGHIVLDAGITVVIAIALALVISAIVINIVKKKSLVFKDNLTSISDIANEKRKTVAEIGSETNSNMDQINVAITQMSQAVTEQASQTEVIMGKMEDFGNNLEGIMNEVTNTSGITRDSNVLMDELKNELAALEEASKRNSDEIINICDQIEDDTKAVDNIKKIVKVIDDISFQITILSFNASVEAARAGDAGRGFAVVAESIKELSDKTQASVEDISGIIETVNNKMIQTGNASKDLMDKNSELLKELVATKERMGSVNEAFDKIAENVTSIQSESQSILIAKNQVTETLSALAAASEENAAMSEEIAATSNIVISTTEGLIEEINKLKVISDTVDQVKQDFI